MMVTIDTSWIPVSNWEAVSYCIHFHEGWCGLLKGYGRRVCLLNPWSFWARALYFYESRRTLHWT